MSLAFFWMRSVWASIACVKLFLLNPVIRFTRVRALLTVFCVFIHPAFYFPSAWNYIFKKKKHERPGSLYGKIISPTTAAPFCADHHHPTHVDADTVFYLPPFPCLWALCWHGLLLHYVIVLHLQIFFLVFVIFFPSHFLSFWSFCNLQPIEVYKDVHGRSELIGWADSQSASKERAAQNPSKQEGAGKRYPKGTGASLHTAMVNKPGLF